MNISNHRQDNQTRRRSKRLNRRGVVALLAAFLLVALFAMVAFTVDTGLIAYTETKMQNAADAAALAASQEIMTAVEDVGAGVDANSIAAEQASAMAILVAQANGVYIDGTRDIDFGKRAYNEATGTWPILWGEGPYNVVRVTAHRDQPTAGDPDAALPLSFGWAAGKTTAELSSSAIGFVEARDLVVVLDYSGSMSYDSQFPAMRPSKLGQAAVEANLDDMWAALTSAGVNFSDVGQSKFPSAGFGGIDSPMGTYLPSGSYSVDQVIAALGLDQVDAAGDPLIPFPQEGKYSNGNLKGRPSASTSLSLWRSYVNFVRGDADVGRYGYRHRYGLRTLVGFLQEKRKRNKHSEDLFRTPHYPFHAMKNGMSLLLQFLDDLGFGDQVGLVTYDNSARVETGVSGQGFDQLVNLGSDLITGNYAAIDLIQRQRQAGHYDVYTGMGYGIYEGRQLLSTHGRYGARPTMLLMTDGQANRAPSGFSLPAGWDWAELTDYDGDGNSDYSTSSTAKKYAFYEAKMAIDAGVTIHTISVGAGADDALMEAIAYAGGGIWIDVPGGATIAEMEAQMLDAFNEIAAKVPPAKLALDEEAAEQPQ